jgi:hypothetical protein
VLEDSQGKQWAEANKLKLGQNIKQGLLLRYGFGFGFLYCELILKYFLVALPQLITSNIEQLDGFNPVKYFT